MRILKAAVLYFAIVFDLGLVFGTRMGHSGNARRFSTRMAIKSQADVPYQQADYDLL